MHPFSIDFITRESSNENMLAYKHCQPLSPSDSSQPTTESSDSFRQTPSPTDSGMASDNSPNQSEIADSIAEALSSLDRRSARVAPTKDTGDKPPHSYIALISMAILSHTEKKMLLCDIYQYIMDNFSFYNNEEKAWRNSIRHNLSLNECFVKNGRADNGKGNYWSIHPACEDDFAKGDFRRRQARRRARKSTKETTGNPEVGMPYRYNIGYVPMTASHIGYHPYGAAASSLLYSHQQPSSYPAYSTSQTTPSSSLTSLSSQLPISFAQAERSSNGYLSSPMTSSSQNYSFSNAAVAAHRLFSEQTTAAFGTQAFQSNHLPTGLQCQSW